MNTDEKHPLRGNGMDSNRREEPLSISNSPAVGNGEGKPGREASARDVPPAAPKTTTREPPEATASAPRDSAEKKPVKRGILIALGCAACVALVLLGSLLGSLLFRGRDQGEPEPSAEVPVQAGSTLPGGDTVATEAPVRETEPADEILSEEELLYRGVEEYCRQLSDTGDYREILTYLAQFTGLDDHDPRFDALLEDYRLRYQADRLETAAAMAESRQYRLAIQTLEKAREIWDSQEFYAAAAAYRRDFGCYLNSAIAAGKLNTFLLDQNGDVSAFGHSMYGELDSNRWSGIIAISAGDRHVVGLRVDGTVIAAGSNDVRQMDVNSWYDIIAISAGDTHTVALKADGTVVATGFNEENQCDMQTLMRNAGEKQIVAVASGYGHTIALLEDGTVAAVGKNTYGECSVSSWTDIVSIVAGSEISAGLRADGTVVATGLNAEKWNVESWSDIVMLAAGDYYLVGLRADGTVVAAGTNDSNYSERGQLDVSGWRDIIVIAAGNDHTVGLRADGTVLCVGSDDMDQCECSGIKLNFRR